MLATADSIIALSAVELTWIETDAIGLKRMRLKRMRLGWNGSRTGGVGVMVYDA